MSVFIDRQYTLTNDVCQLSLVDPVTGPYGGAGCD
jgi:hypothetical protein